MALSWKGQGKRRKVSRKIIVERAVNSVQEITVRHESFTLRRGAFESYIGMWTKMYDRP
ncbi:MAG: hypothetical protein MUO29_06985 [Desulfobacterales bacterium]|nr:hypothetical protein [Desulfobacterales bacterium]